MSRNLKLKLLPVAFIAAGFIVSSAALGVTANAAPLFRTEKTLEIVALGKKYEFFYPEIDYSCGEYYLKNAKSVVDGIFKDTVVRPRDACYRVEPSAENAVTYDREENGKGVDEEKLLNDISVALNKGVKRIIAEEKILYPTVKLSDLKERTQLVSSFSTVYNSSLAPRKNNIALAAKYISYKVLKSGEEFSFNEIVGKRSEERGFSSAKVIENGKFTEGVGGGVCQVSSTVYASALSAGLKITERRNHSLLVGYTEPSFDAMVSSASDLKFVNPYPVPVIIVVDADGCRVRARVYGEKTGAVYKLASEVSEYIDPPEEQIIETYDLLCGERLPMVYAKRGAKSQAYLEKFVNGELVSRVKISSDYYSPLTGITLVGKSRGAN